MDAFTVRDQLFATESSWRLARIKGLRRAGLSKTILAYSFLGVLLGAPEQRASLTQIAQLLGVPRSNLTYVVSELEKDGLIERDSRRDSPDHRVVKISLTLAGRVVAERVQTIEASVAKAITDNLSAEEQSNLLEYLGQLASSARSLLPDPL